MKLLALDANSIINRAFYGVRPLTTRNGVPTNAIYGFMNILLKLKEQLQPDVIAAAFDLKAPTFRHEMYAEYKAGRRPMPDELREQIPIMKQLLRELGCVVLEREGYEADDILGTLATQMSERGDECVIATGDRDSLQLVDERVHVLLAATRMGRPEITEYDPAAVMEKYGVAPREMLEIKALQGDSSDNIPGVAGIGEKTAGALIAQYHSIDYIYEHLEQLEIKDSVRAKLSAGRESAYLSRRLGEICRSVPIELSEPQPDSEALRERLISLEMFKLCERLGLDATAPSAQASAAESAQPVSDECIIDAPQLPDGAVVTCGEGLLAAKSEGRYYIFTKPERFAALLSAVGIICHDAKALYHNAGAVIDAPFDIAMDTQLAAYLLNPDGGDYSLERLSAGRCAAHGGEYAPLLQALDAIELLQRELAPSIEQNGQQRLLNEIEIPLTFTLYNMERLGFRVDREGIERFGAELSERAEALKTQIFAIIGYEFNLNSPKQLGEALFEKLGLPHSKKTKTGYSTGAEVLEGLRYESEAVELLLEYRTVSKLQSTYCEGMLKQIGEDGRIHSTLKQTETRTGRLSSAEPNLQNIPIRTPLGREMRRFFTAADGCVLVDADYSQIELRVLAATAQDEAMCAAFESGEDIHAITASQVFNVPLSAMTPALRSKAKAVNFGIVYGIGAFSLSKDIGVSVAEAREYIEGYLQTYHGVREYLNNTVEQARQNGYVTTAFGRRRYLPELKSSNFNLRAFGERVAKNMPIQGTAADIIKLAMLRVDERLRREGLAARLIMQVHDELLVECPESEAERVSQLVREQMESAVEFRVKMKAEVSVGKSWYDAH